VRELAREPLLRLNMEADDETLAKVTEEVLRVVRSDE